MRAFFIVLLVLLGLSFGSYEECLEKVKRGDVKGAASIAMRLVEEGKRFEGFSCFADAATVLGDYRTAFRAAELAAAEAKTPYQKIESYSRIFKVLLDVGDLKGAEKVLRRILETFRNMENPDSGIRYAVLFNVALYHWSAGNHEEALNYFFRALEVAPGDRKANVYNNVALVYASMGRFEKAVEFYRMALRHAEDPYRRSLFLVNLGSALINLGKLDEAEKVLLEGTENGKQFGFIKAYGLYLLGRLYVLKEDYGRAIKALRSSLSIARDLGLKDVESSAESLLTVALERREEVFAVACLEDQIFKVALLTLKGEGERYLKVLALRVRSREDMVRVNELIETLKSMKNLKNLKLCTTRREKEGFPLVPEERMVRTEFQALVPPERAEESILIRVGYGSTYIAYREEGRLRLIRVPYGMISASDFSKSGAEFFEFLRFLLEDEFYQAVVFEGGRRLRGKRYVYLTSDVGLLAVAAVGDGDLTPLKEKRITLSQLESLLGKLRERIEREPLEANGGKVTYLDLYELYAGTYILKGVLELLGKREVLFRNHADWVTFEALRESLGEGT